jgi:hypothetical protein
LEEANVISPPATTAVMPEPANFASFEIASLIAVTVAPTAAPAVNESSNSLPPPMDTLSLAATAAAVKPLVVIEV